MKRLRRDDEIDTRAVQCSRLRRARDARVVRVPGKPCVGGCAHRLIRLDGDHRVLAGMNVNIWDVLDNVKALIRSRNSVDPDRLADAEVPLAELLG